MTQKFKKEIIKQVTFVSGVIGLASNDMSKSNIALPKEKYENSISILETNSGIQLSIFIIVDADVRAEVIAYEITSSIKALFKKNNISLHSSNVYIRGVK